MTEWCPNFCGRAGTFTGLYQQNSRRHTPKLKRWGCRCGARWLTFGDRRDELNNVYDYPGPEKEFEFYDARVLMLRGVAAQGLDFGWDHHGMLGIIPNAVVKNALAEYDAHQMKRDRRSAIPPGVGKFTWSQTKTLEQMNELRKRDAATEATGSSEPNQ